ncbi:hypothetical protein [Mesorhizobium wenxiniae]|uniref:Uncharacterized protein n=1 Tax=Mesorhizobium wenxiniae TaxID=2014805 RepID=A0A271K6L9_9HYPH|nr:hypothetical protein [Mesorhizobium wenxiniae]PAP91391.1 hypothetical protein CIT31_32465 [Mesorhizobium wenxiniae]
MAIVKLVDTDGLEVGCPERLSGDEFDGQEVTIVVCSTGQFVDGNSEELRFVPAPEPPVIERVVVDGSAVEVDTDLGDVSLASAEGLKAELAAIEEHTAKMTGEPVRPDLIMRRYLGLE